MKEYLTGKFCYKTDRGLVRENNEDQALALVNENGNVLLLVLDGMGGVQKGDLASKLALESIKSSFENKRQFKNKILIKIWIKQVIRKANQIVYNESLKDIKSHGMGTTLTMILIIKNHKYVAQIGDSRAYEIANGKISCLTIDQSYTQYLLNNHKIKKGDEVLHPQRHILSNVLGVAPTVNIDLIDSDYKYNSLLLCSDGLYNNIQLDVMESIMNNNDSVEQKCNEFISIANDNGGDDNIAVVIWEAKK